MDLGEIDGFWFLAKNLEFPITVKVVNNVGASAEHTYNTADDINSEYVELSNLL